MKKTILLFFACLLATNLLGQSEVTPYLYLENKNGEVEAILFTNNGTMFINGNLILINTPEEIFEFNYDEIDKFYFKFLVPCQDYYNDPDYWNELNIIVEPQTVTVLAEPSNCGAVTGGGTYPCGKEITVTAIPNECYHFVNWTSEGKEVSTSNPYFLNIISDITLVANFAKTSYTVTVAGGSNGTVLLGGEPVEGIINVACGDDLPTFTFVPDICYEIDQVLIDGVNNTSAVATGSYTFENVTQNHTISVSFKIKTFTIEATSGENGSIIPDGEITVICGADKTFIFQPDECYHVAQVWIDGVENSAAAANGYYIFLNVSEEHSISVAFAINTYTVTPLAENGGSISPSTVQTVECGENLTFTATPNNCQEVDQWLVNGVVVQEGETNYTISDIQENTTVSVTFKTITYTMMATCGANGSIELNGPITVLCGVSQTFTFIPDECYRIAQVWIDGQLNSYAVENGFYTFENVMENHTIHVTFAANNFFTITATHSVNGSISPDGEVAVLCKGSQRFEFTPDEPCYEIEQVLIDGVNNPDAIAAGFYTFENVTENHSIYISFKIKSLNITAEVIGGNGAIIPNGELPVICGADKTFIFQPDECYHVAQVWIDGVENPDAVANGYHIFLNVSEAHSISVSFAINTYTVTPLAENGGSISPSTVQTVECGENLTFTATPNDCYEVDQWLVNGVVVQEGETNYTISDIQENTTVSVTFKTITYTIMASCGANGSIEPNGAINVLCDGTHTFTFIPDECYRIAQVWIDGIENPEAVENGYYTFENITENHTIFVTFEHSSFFTITATSNENGVISPAGEAPVLCGNSQRFDFEPAWCYEIDEVWIDDVLNSEAIADGFYIFENVLENHTISVSFKLRQITITVSSGDGGTISISQETATPKGKFIVDCGSSITFWALPDDCHEIDQWFVNGAVVHEGGATYTLSDVEENTEVKVTFKRKAYTIQPTVINGSVTPSGIQTIDCDDNITFCFTPDSGCEIEQVIVDGEPRELTEGCYTFYNVMENHTIFVTFKDTIVGIKEITTQNILIYPNPTSHELFIKSELPIKKVEVYTITGALLLSESNFKEKISVAALATGVYMVKVYTDSNIVVKKIVREYR